MTDWKQWQGLRALINDAVEHGTTAVQRVHLATANRPFAVVESIPSIAEAARTVHGVHDAFVNQVYDNIRLVNAIVGKTLEAGLGAMEEREAKDETREPPQSE
jgi:hypothetical protein